MCSSDLEIQHPLHPQLPSSDPTLRVSARTVALARGRRSRTVRPAPTGPGTGDLGPFLRRVPPAQGDSMILPDRRDAGRRLAARCTHLRAERPVAREVALALGAPLDVLVVTKVRDPHHPALGRVADLAVDWFRVHLDAGLSPSGR